MIRFLPKNTAGEEFVPFPDLAQAKPTDFKLNPNLAYITILAASVLAIGFSTVIIFQNVRARNQSGSMISTPNLQATINPTATPAITTLPQGAQTYNFSHGKDVDGPKPTKLVIDPLDPGQGGAQTITLNVAHNSPVLGAAIEIITDNTTTRQTLSLTDGTNTQGTWSGSWTLTDSYNSNYGLKILLQSANGRFDNIMWFRQAAQGSL